MKWPWRTKTGAAPSAADLAGQADAARDRRDWAVAARLYRASLAADPSPPDLWVQLGHALKEGGDRTGAGGAYEQALRLAPDKADTWLQSGHLHKLSGRLSAAADAYARAAALSPANADAREEMRVLAARGVRPAPEAALAALSALRPDALPVAAHGPSIVFDVSDLIGYFRAARLPTGIQRVQIEVIAALLRDPPADAVVRTAAFTEGRDGWTAIDDGLFLEIADLARAGGGLNDADWRRALDRLALTLEIGPDLAFAPGAWLVNLGTSWWLQNYFLRLREAKRLHGVRYLPFVHDMIPVMAPEHCIRGLVEDFVSWTLGVFDHADAFLTNSRASRRDLKTVAERLGRTVAPDRVEVVPLDADFRREGQTPQDEVLARHDLQAEGFVLFVSTIESRKNHLAAFRAWRALIDRHGEAAVPDLVCVGNRGWLNDGVFARLDADPVLRRKVQMLSGVPDPDLAALYAASAFTLYPSSCEGWGLPVTESLCHGRVPLISDAAALPEAGGGLAVMVRDGDLPGLTAALERLMFDLDHRRALEDRIVREFRPRAWRDLADQITARIADWRDRLPDAPVAPMVATPGRFHAFARSRDVSIPPRTVGGEAARADGGWAAPEDWGCPTRAGQARIVADVPTLAGRPSRLFIGLRGQAGRVVRWRLNSGGEVLASGRLHDDAVRWTVRSLPVRAMPDGRLELRLTSMVEDAPDAVHGVGVAGFMICAEDDLATRAAFMEGLATGDITPFAAAPDAEP